MKFNLLTYLFEILNFFVLLWILRKLLYKPVISVLRKRRELIDESMEKAKRLREEAERLKGERERLTKEIEEFKRQRMAEVIREVEEEKSRLFRELQEEVSRERERSMQELERNRKELIREIEDTALSTALAFSSKVLSELADRHTTNRLALISLKVLEDMDMAEAGWNEEGPLREALIESAHPLSEDTRALLESALRAKFGKEITVKETTDPELIAGLRIKAESLVIDLSLTGQLKSFETYMRRKIESEE